MIDTDKSLLFIGKVRAKLAQNNFYDSFVVDELASLAGAEGFDYDNVNAFLILHMKLTAEESVMAYNFFDPIISKVHESRSARLFQILGKEDAETMLSSPKRLFYTIICTNDGVFIQF